MHGHACRDVCTSDVTKVTEPNFCALNEEERDSLNVGTALWPYLLRRIYRRTVLSYLSASWQSVRGPATGSC